MYFTANKEEKEIIGFVLKQMIVLVKKLEKENPNGIENSFLI